MRRFTLITLILLLLAIVGAALFQVSTADRQRRQAPSPTRSLSS